MSSLAAQENFYGNDKHFKVLIKALSENNVALWNDFALSMGPQFKADLRGANLKEQNLSGIHLVKAHLENVCFDTCDLTNANLSGADLKGASFKDALMTGAKLKQAGKIRVVSSKKASEIQEDPILKKKKSLAMRDESARALLDERQRKEKEQTLIQKKVRDKNRGSSYSSWED